MTRKKIIIAGTSGLIVIVVIAGIYLFNHPKQPAPAAVVSDNKSITLKDAFKDMRITNGGQIAGTYTPQKDQSLFYAISEGQALVAAGGIMPDETGAFSRNIAFNSPVEAGKELTLKVYVQDNNGKTVDQLSVPTTYQ